MNEILHGKEVPTPYGIYRLKNWIFFYVPAVLARILTKILDYVFLIWK
jgi:hypothetical protein